MGTYVQLLLSATLLAFLLHGKHESTCHALSWRSYNGDLSTSQQNEETSKNNAVIPTFLRQRRAKRLRDPTLSVTSQEVRYNLQNARSFIRNIRKKREPQENYYDEPGNGKPKTENRMKSTEPMKPLSRRRNREIANEQFFNENSPKNVQKETREPQKKNKEEGLSTTKKRKNKRRKDKKPISETKKPNKKKKKKKHKSEKTEEKINGDKLQETKKPKKKNNENESQEKTKKKKKKKQTKPTDKVTLQELPEKKGPRKPRKKKKDKQKLPETSKQN